MHTPHPYFTSCYAQVLLTHTIPIPHKASVERQDENAPQHRTERLLSETRAAVSGERLCIELAKRSMLDIELGKRSMPDSPQQVACALTQLLLRQDNMEPVRRFKLWDTWTEDSTRFLNSIFYNPTPFHSHLSTPMLSLLAL